MAINSSVKTHQTNKVYKIDDKNLKMVCASKRKQNCVSEYELGLENMHEKQ